MRTTRRLLPLVLLSALLLPACTASLSRTENVRASLSQLLASDQDRTCTLSVYKDGVRSDVTVRVQHGRTRLRADVITTITVEGSGTQTITATLLRDGHTAYVWNPERPGGLKVSAYAGGSVFGSQRGDTVFDLEDGAAQDFICSNGSVRDDVFTPPADRQFTDVDASIDAMLEDDGESGAFPDAPEGERQLNRAKACAVCRRMEESDGKRICLLTLRC